MVIKDSVADLGDGTVYLKNHEKIHLGVDHPHEHPYVALKYFDSKYECFSQWSSEQLSGFSEFNRKMGESNWNQIFFQGGKPGSKTGFGYTQHKDPSALPNKTHKELLSKIDPNIKFFELRAGIKPRVHGFRVKAAFYLVWLDKDHRIYPRK